MFIRNFLFNKERTFSETGEMLPETPEFKQESVGSQGDYTETSNKCLGLATVKALTEDDKFDPVVNVFSHERATLFHCIHDSQTAYVKPLIIENKSIFYPIDTEQHRCNRSRIEAAGHKIEQHVANNLGDSRYQLFNRSIKDIERQTYKDGATHSAVITVTSELPSTHQLFSHAFLFRVKLEKDLLACMAYDSNGTQFSGSCTKVKNILITHIVNNYDVRNNPLLTTVTVIKNP